MTKTAYWIVRTHLIAKDQYQCSACRFLAEEPFGFCPDCGAKTEGQRKDQNWIDEAEQIDSFL